MAPVTAIRNLGPASAAQYRAAGLATEEAVREIGADAAYARLIGSGVRPHFIAYYALVLGLQGRPWTDCGPDEKAALRARFDALVAARTGADAPDDAIVRILDEIGTGRRRGESAKVRRSAHGRVTGAVESG